ncbi:hypothetical protein GF312_10530 [Candidatus Poribacteria bacterium]|nr:hypothetical protein [Candidatus Poribacteria bacterium]
MFLTYSVFASLTVACLSFVASQDAIFYVSPDGNDLQTAVNEARKIGVSSPRRIVVKDGEYFLDKPVMLDNRDNGLVIEADSDAEPVFYGGREISGWEKDGDKFYSVELPGVKEGDWDFRALVVNGRFCPRSRLPEEGTFKHLSVFDVPWMSTTGGGWKRKPTDEELTTMKFHPKDMGEWFVPENAEVTVYHMWDESTVGVKEVDFENNIMTFATPTGHPAGAFDVKKYVVWNLRQGMTQPGQWYLDRAEGKLVYWPLPGEDMKEARAIAPVMESIIIVQGEKENPLKDIAIYGLSFEVTTTPLIAGGFGAGRFDGAVNITNSMDCFLQSIQVSNAAGQGIKVNNSKIHIQGCHIHHVGACGIRAAGCHVTDNRIHHVGLLYPSAIGLVGGGTDGIYNHNEIHDTPYSAITCGGPGHDISYNRIYRAMQMLHDGAGIYCFAGDNLRLSQNFIYDIEDTGGYGASAYYLDERSTGCVVENNVSVNVARPSHNHMAVDNTIRNNVFVYDGDAVLTFPKSSEYTVEKNVIYATGSITFTNIDGISKLKNNVIFSGKGKIVGKRMNNYSDAGESSINFAKKNVVSDPMLVEYKDGKILFDPDSPVKKLGINPLDVSNAGPRG